MSWGRIESSVKEPVCHLDIDSTMLWQLILIDYTIDESFVIQTHSISPNPSSNEVVVKGLYPP